MFLENINLIIMMICHIINVLVVLYGLYYIVIGLCAFKKNKKYVIKEYDPKYKIAVIIPARNEENVIDNLVDSLNKQNYPKELYDVFVVPNGCNDRTKERAEFYNAKIIECNIELKTKGEVLKYTFNYMKENMPDYQAYVIFDADNIVHREFLSRMNDTLCSGYRVAQGYRDSKNPSDSCISGGYSLYYLIQNLFLNQARMNIGWSSCINGTGFMVAKEVIDKYGFNMITTTEDIEFQAICVLNKEKIAFVRKAITYDEQPLRFVESWKQRKRWSIGTFQCLRHYFKDFVKGFTKEKIPQCIDMIFFFAAPFMQIISTFVIAIIAINLLITIGPLKIGLLLIGYTISIIGSYLGFVLMATFVVMFWKKDVIKMRKGILTFAVFMAVWTPINFIAMFKKESIWVPIEHKKIINIDNMISEEKI